MSPLARVVCDKPRHVLMIVCCLCNAYHRLRSSDVIDDVRSHICPLRCRRSRSGARASVRAAPSHAKAPRDRWDQRGRIDGLLLSSEDVQATDELIRRRGDSAVRVPQALIELRDRSRAKLTAEDRRQLRIIGRAFVKPDGLRIIAVSGIFDAATGRRIALLEGHTGGVDRAAISADGKRIVTASFDKTARVWDAATGTSVATLVSHTGSVRSAAFSPDGQRVITGAEDNTARIWDVETGTPIAKLTGHTGVVWYAEFSPDGQRVVTASDDKTARIWDAATGEPIAHLAGHAGSVRSARYSSPDGQRIVTVSDDKTARVWDVSRSAVLLRNRSLVIAAALAHGIGLRTDVEASDLLLQDAPGDGDLFAAALEQTGRKPDDVEIAEVDALLSAPSHPNCYLSPTQLAERYPALPTSHAHKSRWLPGLGLVALIFALGVSVLMAIWQIKVTDIVHWIRTGLSH